MKISAEKSRSYVNSVDDPWLYDEHGFHENCSGVADPHITFSHTGIWHAGSGKIVQAYHGETYRLFITDQGIEGILIFNFPSP